MFPIADVHGKVVAFSGRALDPAPSMEAQKEPPAKYLNSPENTEQEDLLTDIYLPLE